MNEKTVMRDESLSRVEQVYRKLKTRILSNEYSPGYQALEPELAKQLGVSRTPVREALIRLESESLIELIPRRGMRVRPLVPRDIMEINQVQTSLEVMAVELLGQKAPSVETLRPLGDALSQMDKALLDDNLETWSEANEKYHRALVNLCGNSRLAETASVIRAQAFRARVITLKLRPKPEKSNQAYRATYQELLSGNWKAAKEIHYQHCIEVSNLLLELLERYKLPHL